MAASSQGRDGDCQTEEVRLWCANCDAKVRIISYQTPTNYLTRIPNENLFLVANNNLSKFFLFSTIMKVKVYPELDSVTSALRCSKMSVLEENSWTGNTDIKNIVINIQCDRVVR